MNSKLENIEKNFEQIELIAKECRKGKFIWITCSSNSVKTTVKKYLKSIGIPNKRGVYSWRGFIVVSTKEPSYMEEYFDLIYRVKK